MSFLLERDTLNGASGKAFVTIDGQVKELFGAKKVQTQAEIASTDMKVSSTLVGPPVVLVPLNISRRNSGWGSVMA